MTPRCFKNKEEMQIPTLSNRTIGGEEVVKGGLQEGEQHELFLGKLKRSPAET